MNEFDRVIQQGLNTPEFLFLVNDIIYVYNKNSAYVGKRREENKELVNLIDSP